MAKAHLCFFFVFIGKNVMANIYGPDIKCFGDSIVFSLNPEHDFLANATSVTVRQQDATVTTCAFNLSKPFKDAIKFEFDACQLMRTAITGQKGPLGFSLDVPVIVVYGNQTVSFTLGCTYDATAKFTASLGVGEPTAHSGTERSSVDTGKGATPGLTGLFLDENGNTRDPQGPTVELGGTVNFQLAINDTSNTYILPRDCYFSDKEKGGTQVAFVSNGCPKSNPLIGGKIKKTEAFIYDISFPAFRIGDSTRLYIFCEVELCISKAKCHKDCWGPLIAPKDTITVTIPGMIETENSTEVLIDVSGGSTAAAVQLITTAPGRRQRRAVNEDDQMSDKLTNYITIIDPYAKGVSFD
uniref:ZP domain-containing protein n=1 Tax=Plectus sambesii TaxID=2011161 RepID=A0A914WBU8_9BILA